MRIKVFISYRRQDTQKAAALLYNKLHKNFKTFWDKEGIEVGTSWSAKIKESLAKSDVVMMLVGKNWREDRLFDKKDWVKKEFELALEQGKRIVPIFIDRNDVPKKSDLPKSVQKLFDFQGLELDVTSSSGMDHLTKKLEFIASEIEFGPLVVEFLKVYSNRYVIEEILRKKSKVTICKAMDIRLKRQVIIRIYNENKKHGKLKKTLFNALEFANSVPHSVQIFDANYQSQPHIVLDFIEGGSLRTVIKSDNKISSQEVMNHIMQIGKALQNVNLDHCNIKPTNILLSKFGKNLYLNPLNRMTEIDKEKIEKDIRELKMLGKKTEEHYKEDLAYLAPEIFNPDLRTLKSQERMEKIDQYQLGLLGIELLTGKMPCTFRDISELAKPPGEEEFRKRTELDLNLKEKKLHRIFHRMTEPSAQNRYPDLEAAMEEISQSTLQPLDVRTVRHSYVRALNEQLEGKGFLQIFYENFMQEDPGIKEKFKRFGLLKGNKNVLESQYNHLQGAVFGLIEYASLIAEGKDHSEISMLEHVAKKHGKGAKNAADDNYYININRSYLRSFKAILVETVCGKDDFQNSAFDKLCRIDFTEREKIKRAWDKVLNTGIEYFATFI